MTGRAVHGLPPRRAIRTQKARRDGREPAGLTVTRPATLLQDVRGYLKSTLLSSASSS